MLAFEWLRMLWQLWKLCSVIYCKSICYIILYNRLIDFFYKRFLFDKVYTKERQFRFVKQKSVHFQVSVALRYYIYTLLVYHHQCLLLFRGGLFSVCLAWLSSHLFIFGEMISFCSCGHCVFWRLHVGTGTTLKSPMLFLFALQSTVIVASMDGTLLIYSIAFSLFSYIGFFFLSRSTFNMQRLIFLHKSLFPVFLSFLLDPCSTCLHAAIFRAEENFDLEFLKCYKNRFWRIIHFCLTWIPCALLLWVVSSNCFMFYILE